MQSHRDYSLLILWKCGKIMDSNLTRGEGLKSKNDNHTESDNEGNKRNEHRRKRVDRIKSVIIVIAILFLILPTIFCIILGIQVNRLQKQVKDLVELHSEYGLTYEDTGDTHYAYAAEQDNATDQEDEPSSNIDKPNNQTSTSTSQNNADSSNEKDSLQKEDLSTEIKDENTATDSNTTDSNTANSNTTNSTTDSNATDSTDSKKEQAGSTNKDTTENDSVEKKRFEDKEVYLTFDDGPSIYTEEILDILDEYGAKATFFVIGKTDKASKSVYRRIVEDGHTLGMHSYSHQYSKIYNSLEDFDKDFTKLWKLLYDTTGYKPTIYRFPGGSDNLVNKNGMEDFIRYLNHSSIVYFDWNVVNKDATGVEYTKQQLIDNVLGGVKIKETSIVLMHDSQTKKTTVESLPGLLEELISGGAKILPLNNEVTPIQMIKADTIK